MKRRKSRAKDGWPPRTRKRPVKKYQPNRTYLHAVEEAIILRDLAVHGGGPDGHPVTAADLMRYEPMRYDPTYLPRVLRRMWQDRTLERQKITAGFGRGSWSYRIRRSATAVLAEAA